MDYQLSRKIFRLAKLVYKRNKYQTTVNEEKIQKEINILESFSDHIVSLIPNITQQQLQNLDEEFEAVITEIYNFFQSPRSTNQMKN